jgi:uncharacterized protein YnzC (UPF0291/DUF896 family)
MWLGLAVLGLEVLVVVLYGGLLAFFVFLIIDCSGTFVGMWIVKKWWRQETQRLGNETKILEKKTWRQETQGDTKMLEMLRQAGFTASESERLCLLRRHYLQQGSEKVCEDLSRLKFVRWLVTTGKLTEEL